MLLALVVSAGCFLFLLAGALWLLSPGTPSPVLDSTGIPVPGSLSEKSFRTINGVRQGMFIKSRDPRNPVLLYLHGGMPDYFLTQRFPTGLEELFTVVWWEQRGAGISYDPGMPPATMTVEQLIADTQELTRHLCNRFGQERIYLMGHSGGTFIGIQVAARSPELFHAYIGVAQISHQLQSERLAAQYMIERFRERGDSAMVQRLASAPVSMEAGISPAYAAVRDEAMHRLGVGTMHSMSSVVTGIFLPSLLFPEYTLTEKVRLWTAKSRSGISVLWDSMVAIDLASHVREIGIPVYFFHGIHDHTCSYDLARSFLDGLKAPVRGFYTFRHSAHSPMFEEPERMRHILQADVLAGANTLADGR